MLVARKASCYDAKAFSTGFKLILPRTSLKTTRMSKKEGRTGVSSWCVISWFYFPWNVNLGNYSSWLVNWRFCVKREEPEIYTDIRDVTTQFCGRRSRLMVSALVSRSSGPGSSPGSGHCVVFLGKTLNSHSTSLHPGVQLGTGEFNAGGNPSMDWHLIQGGVEKLLVASCHGNRSY